MIPEVDKTYTCFDDGKITISRMYDVTVKEVIPFDKADKILVKEWKKEIEICHWLYAKETDFFIKAEHPEDGECYFARTKNDGWFSLGFWAGRLDLDNSLTRQALSYE